MTAREVIPLPSPSALMAVIVRGLTAQARGEQVDEEGMQEAASLLAAAQLVHAGMSMAAVERQFRDRDHSFKFTYDGATDDLEVSVIWDDDEVTQ